MRVAVRAIVVAVAALFCNAQSGVLAQDINVDEKTVYYDVSGQDYKAVRQNIKTYSQLNHDNGNRIARTRINISFSLELRVEPLRCSIKEYEVVVDLEILLPFWIDMEEATARDRKQWGEFYSAVVRHEKTHVAIAKAMAEQTSAILSETRAAGTCEALKVRAENAVSSYLETTKAQQQYDDYTRHDPDRDGFDITAATRRQR